MNINDTIDIASLVEDGLLDLDVVFALADWTFVNDIDTYTACAYGSEGDEPGEVQVVLESATEYGITAYRWAEQDDSGRYETGLITLDRDEAIASGAEYVGENDEEPDVDDLIRQIVETRYFGAADAADIAAICEEATKYSEGYLLLPAGEFCGRPIGRLWTTNGYLECENYITLNATHPKIAYAADALFRAVTAEEAA